MRPLIALAVAVVVASTPVIAQDKPPPEEKIICKRNSTFSTGSHLSRPKKVCMKDSDWKQTEDEKNRTIRKVQDGKVSPDQPTPLGGGPG